MTLSLVPEFAIVGTVAAAAAPAAAPVGGQPRLEPALAGQRFAQPTDIANAGDGSGRLFVTEQQGRVLVAPTPGEPAAVFLDIRDRVSPIVDGEEGLLGLAFHPGFSANGYFFVDYIAADSPRRTVVSRFQTLPGTPNAADPTSEQVLLEVDQPYSNHNGGAVRFGSDGYLYIALGDGGAQGDPGNTAQNLRELLGKILRIDVDNPQPPLAYGIPPDNPYANNSNGWRPEIFARGFRNPWRMSFDRQTGALWVGDVGGGRIEEVDLVLPGANYGWSVVEGTLCFKPATACDTANITMPVWEYGHGVGTCITGGFVYRGSQLNGLVGRYVYGDWGAGVIWALDVSQPGGPVNATLLSTAMSPSTFGEDESGELYVADYATGGIYRLGPSPTNAPPATWAKLARLEQNEPNPFNPGTRIEFELSAPGHVAVGVFDVRGALVRTLLRRQLDAGVHLVQWDGVAEDGSACASGVYHYRVEVDGTQAKARAMALVR